MKSIPRILAIDGTRLRPARTGIENFVHQLLPPLVARWGASDAVVFASDPGLLGHVDPAPTIIPAGGRLWTQAGLPGALRRSRAAILYNPIPILPVLAPLPCPAVVTVHDLHEFRRHWGYMRLLLGRTFALARAIVCVSQATAEEVAGEFPAVTGKLAVVHEGADPAVFHPAAGPDAKGGALLARFGISEAPLLAVGTLQPRKNYARMIGAYARLPGGSAPPLLIVGGKGWEAEAILDLPARLGVADRVVFAGHLPESDLGELMRASRLLLALSTGEGFGLPVVEAMYSGLPILASDIPPFREVAGNAARFVSAFDEAGIAAGLQRLLAQPGELAAMAQTGVGRRGLFTWERAADGVVEVLQRVLANPPLTRAG